MATNSFGNIFRITTFGESHGRAVGVVIDGCPAGLPLAIDEINQALAQRAPGKSEFTSPRKEQDIADIYSGIFEGQTTGAPICIMVMNKDADSSKYEPIKDLLRPGHANFTYLEKYGIFDYRGGGRSSARETIGRVAAGAVAKKILQHHGIEICSYMQTIGDVHAQVNSAELEIAKIRENTYASPVYCPDQNAAQQMMDAIQKAKDEGDSLGAAVAFFATGMPIGLGDPIYEKLEANLAKAMMSLPASKGFEIGEGFAVSHMTGSAHNDAFIAKDHIAQPKTNHAGGLLAGISTGMPLLGRIAFKPTSSIKKQQQTVDTQGEAKTFLLPEGSRHDPCVAIRAVPIVEAMCALVLVDALLLNRSAKL